MIHDSFFTLKTICIIFIIPSYANSSSSSGTQFTLISASTSQNACTNLDALPLSNSKQKETWVVGRATRAHESYDTSQNNCQPCNFGPNCQAMQISITMDQDGRTRDVSLYAYNTKTDTVAYCEGKYTQLDNNYEIYREEINTKLSINREGTPITASTLSQGAVRGLDFAKVAQSKDGQWTLLESCDRPLAWVLFQADLLSNDPQMTFVERYRQNIDETLKQCNIDTTNMVEVQLMFPFAVPEVVSGQSTQHPSTTQTQNDPYGTAPAPSVSSPSSTVYIAYKPPSPPPPQVYTSPTKSTVIYGTTPSTVISASLPSPQSSPIPKSAVFYSPSQPRASFEDSQPPVTMQYIQPSPLAPSAVIYGSTSVPPPLTPPSSRSPPVTFVQPPVVSPQVVLYGSAPVPSPSIISTPPSVVPVMSLPPPNTLPPPPLPAVILYQPQPSVPS